MPKSLEEKQKLERVANQLNESLGGALPEGVRFSFEEGTDKVVAHFKREHAELIQLIHGSIPVQHEIVLNTENAYDLVITDEIFSEAKATSYQEARRSSENAVSATEPILQNNLDNLFDPITQPEEEPEIEAIETDQGYSDDMALDDNTPDDDMAVDEAPETEAVISDDMAVDEPAQPEEDLDKTIEMENTETIEEQQEQAPEAEEQYAVTEVETVEVPEQPTEREIYDPEITGLISNEELEEILNSANAEPDVEQKPKTQIKLSEAQEILPPEPEEQEIDNNQKQTALKKARSFQDMVKAQDAQNQSLHTSK